MGTLNKMFSVLSSMMSLMKGNPFLTTNQARNITLQQNRSYHANNHTRKNDYSWKNSKRANSIKRRSSNRKALRR